MMKDSKFIIIVKWGALLGAGLSVINLLGFFAVNTGYYYGPVKDLLQVLAIVACLYLAIRDVRDKMQDGLIKFSKAFGIGCGVVFIGYVILALYMMLQLAVFEKDGLGRLNRQNTELAIKSIQQDTITTAEIKDYHKMLKRISLQETHKVIANDTLQMKADSGVVVILKRFERELTLKCKHDTTGRLYQLDTFDICADQQLRSTLYSVRMGNPEILPVSLEAVEAARDSLAENPVWKQRLATKQVPQYLTIPAAGTITTLAALLYGLMINIFVALFLYRKEKTICSRNGNDPVTADEEPDTETETEVKTEENHSEQ